MKKLIGIFVSVLIIASVGLVLAGNSGVSDPTITVTQTSPTGGFALRDKIHESLDSLDTAVRASIDVLDAVKFETGTATNTEVVAFSLTYSSAPMVVITSGNSSNIAYASSITTTNYTANMKAGETNNYVVVPAQ